MSRPSPYLKLVALVVLIGAAMGAYFLTPLRDVLALDRVAASFETLRASMWAPAVFVVLYATATALAIPGSALTIAGGAVFGFWFGSLLNTIGANIGANAAFGLSRALGRDGVERIAGKRLEGLDKASAEHGFLGLLVLRLIPLVPFNALNFGSGLTAIRWVHYALATVVGILPGTLVYTFFADALVEGSTSASQDARTRLWIAGVLFLALALIPLVAKRLGFRLKTNSSREVA